ncbi:hypothetical protein SUDANB145_07272 (plasmid) [Streptomyces sp. enrichment culture]
MRIPPLLTECLIVAAIACATAWTWLSLTDSHALSPGAVIVCTGISVAIAMGVESVVHRARRGRPRHDHGRRRPAGRRPV